MEPEEFDALERIGRTLAFRAKATIFEQGREAGFVYNLTSGALRLSKLLRTGAAGGGLRHAGRFSRPRAADEPTCSPPTP